MLWRNRALESPMGAHSKEYAGEGRELEWGSAPWPLPALPPGTMLPALAVSC